MLMFILAISCLTSSNLTWFVDLTFQIPMQYCSWQHPTLLPSPVTSTTGCYFHFGSISSFFLQLFLHSSPVAHWVPTDLGRSSFIVIYFCLFILFREFSYCSASFHTLQRVLTKRAPLERWSEVAQSCPTLCDPMGCSLPGPSVHGIFQAIVLEWIAISFSRGSSQPRDRTRVSRNVDRRFTIWTTREVHFLPWEPHEQGKQSLPSKGRKHYSCWFL